MPQLCSVVRRSGIFLRKQPVLTDVALWLVVVPYTGKAIFLTIIASAGWNTQLPGTGAPGATDAFPLVLAIGLVVLLCQLWAEAAALTVAKRLLSRNAGRVRTSFRAVLRQSRGVVLPILLTEILWVCSTMLWGLLFILPGIVYATRAIFFPIIIVAEGKRYRDALRASIAIVRGRTLLTLIRVLGIMIVAFVPYALTGIAIDALAIDVAPWPIRLAGITITNLLLGFGVVAYEVMLTMLYAEMKKGK